MKTVFHSGQRCNVVDSYTPVMFRTLSEEEACNFRAWADKQEEGIIINPSWHPIVQDQLFITGRGVEE